MSVRRPHQRDLFESKQTLPEMVPDQRGKVMVLLQALPARSRRRARDRPGRYDERGGRR
jgi:hypothetical protein